mmetsp:Transcript_2736/g.4981  ORF Transcript_2736/g.4981 Transcript_2736/m.4981 type:complete len:521 (-) Transcript_2736:550-2112(-)
MRNRRSHRRRERGGRRLGGMQGESLARGFRRRVARRRHRGRRRAERDGKRRRFRVLEMFSRPDQPPVGGGEVVAPLPPDAVTILDRERVLSLGQTQCLEVVGFPPGALVRRFLGGGPVGVPPSQLVTRLVGEFAVLDGDVDAIARRCRRGGRGGGRRVRDGRETILEGEGMNDVVARGEEAPTRYMKIVVGTIHCHELIPSTVPVGEDQGAVGRAEDQNVIVHRRAAQTIATASKGLVRGDLVPLPTIRVRRATTLGNHETTPPQRHRRDVIARFPLLEQRVVNNLPVIPPIVQQMQEPHFFSAAIRSSFVISTQNGNGTPGHVTFERRLPGTLERHKYPRIAREVMVGSVAMVHGDGIAAADAGEVGVEADGTSPSRSVVGVGNQRRRVLFPFGTIVRLFVKVDFASRRRRKSHHGRRSGKGDGILSVLVLVVVDEASGLAPAIIAPQRVKQDPHAGGPSVSDRHHHTSAVHRHLRLGGIVRKVHHNGASARGHVLRARRGREGRRRTHRRERSRWPHR